MKFLTGMNAIEHMLITHDWSRHRKFLDLLEPYLAEVVHDWGQELDRQARQIDDEEQRDEFYHFHIDDYHDMTQHRVILMNSFFTASFALFEYHLTWLCGHVQQSRDIPFSVNDLKYSLTNRAKSYLTKLCIPFPSDAPEWQEINRYQEIRNKIMHEGGFVSDTWGNYSYADANGIVNAPAERLELTRPFCEKALKDFERFLLMVSHSTGQATEGRSDS